MKEVFELFELFTKLQKKSELLWKDFEKSELEDFPAQKAFISWRSAGRRGRMVKAGQVLEERIFVLHTWFSSLDFAKFLFFS